MPFELDFLPVGNSYGDAIVVRYGEQPTGGWLYVIDGGRLGTADTIIKHIEKYYPNYHINHMIVSHADNDHACGLIDVFERFDVKHLWMNRPWLYAAEVLHHFHGNFTLEGLIQEMKNEHSYLVELEALANERDVPIHEVFQGASIGHFGVLAPSRQRYIDLIPEFEKTPDSYKAEATEPKFGILKGLIEAAKKWLDEKWDIETLSNNSTTSASNESCVVLHAKLDDDSILLTADVGPEGLRDARDYADILGFGYPDFMQMPHHGSRHNVTPDILDRWLGPPKPQGTVGGTSFCSIGANMPDYPRGQVKNAFKRRGYEVYANRTQMISYSAGGGHPNMHPLQPEPFAHKVEAP
jgi:beta-lactamase superfamily II metal-dependent hydrolase